jgi:hypothetical protein
MPASRKPVTRRTFVKSAGAAAIVAGGIEGILAARRAPAFAQGTKLHWVRWVDFVPESDVELKRQMPRPARPSAPRWCSRPSTPTTCSRGSRHPSSRARAPTSSLMQYNWPQLYQNALVDVSDVAGELGKAEGGFYEIFPPVQRQRQVALRAALDRGQRRRLPQLLAEGGGARAVSRRRGTRRASSSRR